MTTTSDLHDQAMELSDLALIAKRRGQADDALRLSRQAYALELAAAESVAPGAEPTRSVLYRSAASLALDCGEPQEAERLIATALAGGPPPEIAEELRELREQAHAPQPPDARSP